MKKKILVISLAVALIAIAVIGGTLAWFTDQTQEEINTFTVGNVDISLSETFNAADAANIVPGRVIDKEPKVTNIGSNPCYVRVKFTIPQGVAGQSNLPDITRFFDLNTTDWYFADWAADSTNSIAYAYYKSVLGTGSVTNAPFTKVTIPQELDNEQMELFGDRFTIGIVAEAIQSEGFEVPADQAAMEAIFAGKTFKPAA